MENKRIAVFVSPNYPGYLKHRVFEHLMHDVDVQTVVVSSLNFGQGDWVFEAVLLNHLPYISLSAGQAEELQGSLDHLGVSSVVLFWDAHDRRGIDLLKWAQSAGVDVSIFMPSGVTNVIRSASPSKRFLADDLMSPYDTSSVCNNIWPYVIRGDLDASVDFSIHRAGPVVMSNQIYPSVADALYVFSSGQDLGARFEESCVFAENSRMLFYNNNWLCSPVLNSLAVLLYRQWLYSRPDVVSLFTALDDPESALPNNSIRTKVMSILSAAASLRDSTVFTGDPVSGSVLFCSSSFFSIEASDILVFPVDMQGGLFLNYVAFLPPEYDHLVDVWHLLCKSNDVDPTQPLLFNLPNDRLVLSIPFVLDHFGDLVASAALRDGLASFVSGEIPSRLPDSCDLVVASLDSVLGGDILEGVNVIRALLSGFFRRVRVYVS